ncbi:hypothetical protein LguiB_000354 [Lonicera macranthoides]
MDSKNMLNHESQALPPIKNSLYQPPLAATSGTSFPIIAIVVLCIMATAFLLVSYYIFVTKCCLNWQQFDPLRRFSVSRSQQPEDLLMAYSPAWLTRGLDQSLIREIPTFHYSRNEGEQRSLYKCVVCLNDFQEQDTLRVLPSCSHGFHLDCIDLWLQSNANCPLCRLNISGTTCHPMGHIVAPTSSPQDPQPLMSTTISDEDFVVIELSGEERNESRDRLGKSISHSPRKFGENKVWKKLKGRKFFHASIMGDEGINIRENDDQFSVQPIRRTFSMDSAVDRHVYLSVQEIIRQQNQPRQGGSRSAVLPVEF